MLRTSEPVIIMTQRELDAMLAEAKKQGAIEASSIRKLSPPSPPAPISADNSVDRYWRLPEVIAAIGLKKTAIYGLIRDGGFPKPVKLGPRAVAWRQSVILAWIQQH